PVEMHAHERRIAAGCDGVLHRLVADGRAGTDGKCDELERALDAVDAGRPIEKAHRGAHVHHVGLIQVPCDGRIAGRECPREALRLPKQPVLPDAARGHRLAPNTSTLAPLEYGDSWTSMAAGSVPFGTSNAHVM